MGLQERNEENGEDWLLSFLYFVGFVQIWFSRHDFRIQIKVHEDPLAVLSIFGN